MSIEDAVNDYQSGMKIADILRKHGVGPVGLYKYLSDNNIPKRNRKYRSRITNEELIAQAETAKIAKVVTAELDSKIVSMNSEGLYPKQIAENLNINERYVRKLLDKLGIKKNRKPYFNLKDMERRNIYVKLYNDGMTCDEIAAKFGVTRQGVHFIIKKYAKTRGRHYYASKYWHNKKALIANDVIADFNNGMSRTDLAKKYTNCKVNKIDEILIENAVKPDDFPLEKVLKLREEGKSYKQIASELGMSVMGVYRCVPNNNKILVKVHVDQDIINKVVADAGTKPIEMIMKENNLTRRHVSMIIIRHAGHLCDKIVTEFKCGEYINVITKKYMLTHTIVDRMIRNSIMRFRGKNRAFDQIYRYSIPDYQI